MCTQSGWGAPARKIIGNGWMKSDCDSTAIRSGAWCNEYVGLYEIRWNVWDWFCEQEDVPLMKYNSQARM